MKKVLVVGDSQPKLEEALKLAQEEAVVIASLIRSGLPLDLVFKPYGADSGKRSKPTKKETQKRRAKNRTSRKQRKR